MNSSKQLFRLTQLMCQATRSNATVPASAKYGRLKKIQEHLGLDDGVRVHIKSGMKDNALVAFTAGCIAIGSVCGIQVFYTCVLKG